ncbi:Mth938-like domain-containing protein [Kangiella marina]|uniref:Mth938-like domain-containing protein n=1 Tax=Kangiella marina TaxID=1079178 RepID=A0ABP8INC6_9GAMM
MDISLDKSSGHYHIKSYDNHRICINDKEYTNPLTVSLDEITQDTLPRQATDINAETLKQLNVDSYEAVLLGTGPNLTQPSWDVIEAAQMMGAPLEVMSTGAACRTFTVLASEGRHVLAILYP